ncbi:MAG: membrane protein insertase YidC [Zoogloeaceae bacterium]|nr:membrane protein insertase YidC [Zoogloeaceae bacterium]
MENRRLILFMVLAFSLFMLWDGWLKHNQPPPPPAAEGQAAAPSASAPAPTPSGSLAAPTAPAAGAPGASAAPRLVVRTDTMVAEISAQGGDLVRLALAQHKDSEHGDQNFVLFDDGAKHLYAAQSGLIGANLPTHKTLFALPAGEQVLQPGQDSLTVRLQAPAENGVAVTKVFTFHRGSYLIDVTEEIANKGSAPVTAHAYFQLTRDGKPAEAVKAFGVHTFTGPAIYTEADKYQKIKFEDIGDGKAKHAKEADNGWVAMVQHYFVSAWLPQEGVQREYYTRKVGDDLYSAGVIVPVAAVEPGQQVSASMRLYAGPQEQDKLVGIATGLDLVVDYGWLTVIAAPLFWVLQWFHKLTGNWGWAIILVTIAIKAVFFPLSAASYKSMAKMRTLGPRLQKLKERYGDDKMKMQQEMMEIYKREKVNPLGGCLPILVQIPVFIALYWVLLGSVEMRHAPWLGWIQDLSVKDPYYVLPIIMGVTMLIQTKLNPAPPDPIQAKVMLAMPIIFTVMFLWFPAGLVLYWVVNNSLSIAQQWQITRMIERGGKASAG